PGDVRSRFAQKSLTKLPLTRTQFCMSSRHQFRAVIVRGVAIERVDVVWTRFPRTTWYSYALGCIFNLNGGALYPKIGGSAVRRRSAPGKKGIREIPFHFGHLCFRVCLIDDADPFLNEIEKHGLLVLRKCCRTDTFRLDHFTVMSGTEHVRDVIIEHRLF